MGAGLENPGLLLQPPDVGDDLSKILPAHAGDLRHVSKFPMVRSHAELRGTVKGGVRMMIGLVYLIEKRRTLRRTACARPMTTGTMGIEQLLAPAQSGRGA
jgi:hypothetical protein